MPSADETEQSNEPKLIEFESFRDKLDDLRESIQERAFELFKEREEKPDGGMQDDWMKAKSDLFERAPVELRETDQAYEVEAEIPQGFSADDLEVSMNDQELFIRGHIEREEESEDEEGITIYSELESRDMFREISLPGPVDREEATGELEGNTLHVTLPKTE